MDDKRFRRFGWVDEVGPLWFLRDKWTAGPRWRRLEVRFFAGPSGITLQAHAKEGGWAVGGEYASFADWADLSYQQKESLIVSWLKKVVNPVGQVGAGAAALDPDWVRELPAVHDYLTLRADTDGTARLTSTLTIFAESGTWKVYLNDRDSGGSLCASGSTIASSLSSLEAMLESEEVPWRFSDRARHSANGKARKGS